MNTGLTNLNVNALALDPVPPSTLYAGTSNGGVFKSTDGGASWTAMNTGLTNLNVNALAIDPVPPSTLYAGTSNGGVFKSTDGGASWTAMNTGLTSFNVNALALDPSNSSTLYAGTNGGVYKSMYGGTLAAEESILVTISINSKANSLAFGSYSDTVSFANTTNGTGATTRSVSLTVTNEDTTPDPFSFTPQTGVALNTVVISNSIPVSGINSPAQISITGGKYLINNGLFTDAPGTVNNGDTVRVQVIASSNYAATTNATLAIGGVSGTFSVTTLPGPIVPPPSYLDLTLTITDTGKGTITFSPGYNCSDTCRQEYGSGATVTLDAVATSDSIFDGWTGCDAVNGTTCTVSMMSARSVSANFTGPIPGTGSVYGRVTDASGSGVAYTTVGMNREYDSLVCSGSRCINTSTDGLGNYLISNIAPGTYTLRFLNKPVSSGSLVIGTVNQWYNNKHGIASADLITISEGSSMEFDAVYPPVGSVSGRVSDTNGAGIANVSVDAFDLDDQDISKGATDSSGNYTIQNLPTGVYKIQYRANDPFPLGAQNLVTQVAYAAITAPDSLSGINAIMSPGRTISGMITNREGLPVSTTVDVIGPNGHTIASASTNSTGAYTALGIPPGSYKLLFRPFPPATGVIDVAKLYSRKFYGGSADYDSASVVTVTADADVSNIDCVLEANGPAVMSSGTADFAVVIKRDFGAEGVGMSSYRSFMLTNVGTADLSLGMLSSTGQDFSILNDRCSGVTLSPLKMCTFQVAFVPKSEGMKTGTISIPSNDPNVPVYTIGLNGSGGAATGDLGTVPLPYGNNVAVAPVPEVNLTFTSVTSSDDTVTVTAITSLTSPPNFLMLNGTSYDITTTATYSAPVTVCITYDPATMSNPANEQNLRLFHYNGSDWQDITTSVDTVAHKIYGQTNSLSPFAVAEPVAAPATYTITASTGPNGSILPSGAVTVRKDAIQIFLIIPNMGYHVADVLVDGVSVGARLLYIFTNVQADHTIAATFAANTGYTITASAGPNGSISPLGAVTVLKGASQAFTITPDAGYRVADVLVDGKSVGAKTSYTFYLVRADHTISASFTPDVYIITATAGPNGSISPSGMFTVNRGDNATFTITPDTGHRIRRVVVDGVNRGAITSYTFTNVRKNHTISAYFK
jgi:hypothetical protein